MGKGIFKFAVFYVGTSTRISEEDAASIFVPDEGGHVLLRNTGVLVPGCTAQNTAFFTFVTVETYIL
jgi:hypothetical protein